MISQVQLRTMMYALALPALFLSAIPAARAQDQPQTHLSTFCIKALPGKAVELEQFVSDVGSKLFQVSMQEKRMSRWTFSRAVTPTGEEAACSHRLALVYEGAPPEPPNALEADLKKAGIKMTSQEYFAKLMSFSKLVLHERFARFAGFGAPEKGTYFQINFMKPLPGKAADFAKFEREVWMPLAEQAAKSGHPRRAWAGWFRIYPSGSESDYDAITVDVFRDWASVWKPQGFSKDAVEKVFPGKTAQDLMAPTITLRNLVHRELYFVVESGRAASQ